MALCLRHCPALAVLFMFVFESIAAPKDKVCADISNQCSRNDDCCGGCCQEGKCVPYSEQCIAASNPCSLYDCPPNKVCYLHKVQCVQAPCPSIPACKSADYDIDYS